MPTASTPVVYRAREVAEQLGIGIGSARRIIREHGTRIGPKLLAITPAALAEYLSRRGTPRATPPAELPPLPPRP